MGWKEIEDAKSGAGLYIKLADGESIQGVFRGEPYTYYSKFGEKEEHKTKLLGTSFRFRINFVVKEGSGYVAKQFQGGVRTAKMLSQAKSKNGLDCIYNITRSGSNKNDTVYLITLVEKLTGAKLAKINQTKLLFLPSNSNGSTEESALPPMKVLPDGTIVEETEETPF